MKKSIFVPVLLFVCFAFAIPAFAKASDFKEALQYYHSGKYQLVVSRLQDYVETNPEPSAYYLMGYSLYKLGRFREANEYFDQAFLIDPNFKPEKSGLPELYPKGGIHATKRQFHHGRSQKEKKRTVTAAYVNQPKSAAIKIDKGAKQPAPAVQSPKAVRSGNVESTQSASAASVKPGTEAKKPVPQNAQAKIAEVQAPKTPVATHDEKNNGKRDAVSNTAPAAVAASGAAVKARVIPGKPVNVQDMKRLLPLAAVPIAMGGLFAGFALFFLLLGLAIYLLYSFFLFLIAKKLNVPNPWTAWVPLVQIWTLVSAAGKPWWWILSFLIPLVNFVVMVYLWICISENMGRNKWLGLLMIVPIVNMVYMGVLALSKDTRGGDMPSSFDPSFTNFEEADPGDFGKGLE